jgi:fatty acid CoA ligase FadD9
VHTVLLTGANGYLGRFLCLEWLERLAKTGGKLICIVRGADPVAARQRIEAAIDSGDLELSGHFRALAANHLKVLAGDLGAANLGVDTATWNRLAESVDLIVHAAAMVNHVLPYGQLFGPNVVGTTEIIKLAITKRLKPITYLSTVAVTAPSDGSFLGEDADVREASASRSLDTSYASGYATSKWACEVLLREAHDLCGLPVCGVPVGHDFGAQPLRRTDQRHRHVHSADPEPTDHRYRTPIVLPARRRRQSAARPL